MQTSPAAAVHRAKTPALGSGGSERNCTSSPGPKLREIGVSCTASLSWKAPCEFGGKPSVSPTSKLAGIVTPAKSKTIRVLNPSSPPSAIATEASCPLASVSAWPCPSVIWKTSDRQAGPGPGRQVSARVTEDETDMTKLLASDTRVMRCPIRRDAMPLLLVRGTHQVGIDTRLCAGCGVIELPRAIGILSELTARPRPSQR